MNPTAWLVFAIAFEVLGTTCMKLSDGFTKLGPSVLLAVFYALSLGALTMALKGLEVGVVYAIWSGLGTALIALVGVFWFGEQFTTTKVACLLLVIVGVIGLQFSAHGADNSHGPSSPTVAELQDVSS